MSKKNKEHRNQVADLILVSPSGYDMVEQTAIETDGEAMSFEACHPETKDLGHYKVTVKIEEV